MKQIPNEAAQSEFPTYNTQHIPREAAEILGDPRYVPVGIQLGVGKPTLKLGQVSVNENL